MRAEADRASGDLFDGRRLETLVDEQLEGGVLDGLPRTYLLARTEALLAVRRLRMMTELGRSDHVGERTRPTLEDGLRDAGTDSMAEECRAWARPWRFETSAIGCPSTEMRGTTDRLIPEAWGGRLAESLGTELERANGKGHLFVLSEWALVLDPSPAEASGRADPQARSHEGP